MFADFLPKGPSELPLGLCETISFRPQIEFPDMPIGESLP
jgi:hypothetical protein